MKRARILGTGAFVPERVVTNYDLAAMMPTSHDWIVAKTGIVERRIAEADQSTSDLALEAALRALDAAEVSPREVDLILLATSTPDHLLPATAAIVQHKLGAKEAIGLDLNAVCSGFVYGLGAADAYIRAGVARTVLLIGADTYSKILDWTDRRATPFFGDGAGAAVLRADEGGSGILAHRLEMDGSGNQTILVPAGGFRTPIDANVLEHRLQYFRMDGHAVFDFAVERWPESVQQVLAEAGLTLDDLSLVIPHQANLRILEQGAAALGLPMERVEVTVDRYGNTASIPMALDAAVREGKVRDGDHIVMVGFGGGLAWGSVAVRW
jgi:3-oxoacyl-[acyl-carrier-protein] synthase III